MNFYRILKIMQIYDIISLEFFIKHINGSLNSSVWLILIVDFWNLAFQ